MEVVDYLVRHYNHVLEVIRSATFSTLSTELIELVSPLVSAGQRAAVIASVGRWDLDALELLLARGYPTEMGTIRDLIDQANSHVVERVLRYHPEHLEFAIRLAAEADDRSLLEQLERLRQLERPDRRREE